MIVGVMMIEVEMKVMDEGRARHHGSCTWILSCQERGSERWAFSLPGNALFST